MPHHNSNKLFTVNRMFNRSPIEAAIVQSSGVVKPRIVKSRRSMPRQQISRRLLAALDPLFGIQSTNQSKPQPITASLPRGVVKSRKGWPPLKPISVRFPNASPETDKRTQYFIVYATAPRGHCWGTRLMKCQLINIYCPGLSMGPVSPTL